MTRFLIMSWGGRVLRSTVAIGVLACFLAGAPAWSFAQSGSGVKGINQILSVSAAKDGEQPAVHIATREPVGYRYTVYDSHDPVRVVIDFPGMDVSGITSPIKVDSSPVQEIRVSSFDLSSGRLGRVELLLAAPTNYNVFLSGNDFRVSFTQSPAGSPPPPVDLPAKEVVSENKTTDLGIPAAPPMGNAQAVVATEKAAAEESPIEPTVVAKRAQSVEVRGNEAILTTDGRIERHEQFSLGAPPRLVVDIFGVKPSFAERAFKASQGFSGIRVGTYPDKTRYVFDAAGKTLPKYTVDKRGSAVVVGWDEKSAQRASSPKPASAGIPVNVEAVDFKVTDGKSLLWVALSGPADVLDAEQEGNVVQFGVKNALISRALRRSIDASAFPSAVRLITPYTVQAGKAQDVRFTVELKGPVPYSLQKEEGGVAFVVDNGPFAEPAPAEVVKKEVPVPLSPVVPVMESRSVATVPSAVPAGKEEPVLQDKPLLEPEKYSGQKISLVFDDADIRRILQLIAEVSDLNIIASDDVKGTITLRLIDVPWDQALDLIMEIKGLGMLREGNVVRVLSQEKIREMRQTQLSAAREERQLEPLVTEAISVSYTDLKNVSGPSKELLSDRGKLTEDSRNKQVIVTDISSAITEVRRLIKILDTPERQVVIEARIVEADASFGRDLGVNWGLTYSKTNTGFSNVSQGDIGLGGGFVIPPAATGAGTAAGLATALTFGELGIDSTVLNLQISALETSGRGKVVSRPRVTTLNGEKAVISQGTKIPYQSVSQDGIKTEFVDAVLSLEVTPVINPDDSIILDIVATNSAIGDNVSTGAGSAPAVDTKEAKTKLLLHDGQTSVIGGIFVESDRYGEAGVPFLRKIPFLGYLFKSSSSIKDRSELMVFITPRIVQ